MNTLISNRATYRIKSVVDYIKRDSMKQGELFENFIFEKIKMISLNPHIGKEYPEPKTRELVIHKNYSIIYKIEGDTIIVTYLKHNKMTYEI